MRCTLHTPFVGNGVFSSKNSSFKGCQNKLTFNKGEAAVVMKKKDIHPKYYEEAKVICNGEEVLTISGTRPEYNVDIWSGNHPFYLGNTSTVVMDEGRVNRFKRRFAGLESLSNVQTVSGNAAAAGEEAKPLKLEVPKVQGKGKGKGKKK